MRLHLKRQDSLTTKSNTFQEVAIRTEPKEIEEVGNVTFNNCTFNISAGGEGKKIDVNKIITDVVAGVQHNMGKYKKRKTRENKVGILKNNYTQSQTIKQIDFGSVSDTTVTISFCTPQVNVRKNTVVINPYKKKKIKCIQD